MSNRQFNHVFPTLLGEVVTDGRSQGLSPLSRRTSFRMEISSTMRQAVFWKNSLGLIICEPPCMIPAAAEYLYIKIEYEFDRGVKIDARGLLDELKLPDNHVERKSILIALNHLETLPPGGNQRKFSYTLGLSKEALERYGGMVYLNDVDLVVGFDTYRNDAIHPFTHDGNRQTLNEAIAEYVGVQQRYLLIDNRDEIGDRWINTGYGVFELKAKHDPKFSDGVYVTTSEGPHKGPKTELYEFPGADKALGLYRTKGEAATYGAPDVRFATELKALEQQVAREKLENQRERQQIEHEIKEADQRRKTYDEEMSRNRAKFDLEVDQHRQQMKMDSERLAFQQETFTRRQKFDYETASVDRKDRSEYFRAVLDIGKAVLGIASLGISVYALVKKQK